jgi:uncharacterized SAM-binding protein YcdF (DUF218 family)
VTTTLTPTPQGSPRTRPTPRIVRRWAVRLVLALLVLLVLYVVVTFLQVWLASRRDAAQSADAIVVLGAAQYDCTPSPVLAERLDHAHELYVDGVADTIVVTGGSRPGDRCTEAQSSADYLREQGVPDDDLLLEVDGRNSWESLAATSLILRDTGLTRAVLVTDGYHALRVQAIAEQLGLDASVSPTRNGGSLGTLLRETGAVALGRVIGFDRLVDIDDEVEQQIDHDRPVDTPTPEGGESGGAPAPDVRSGAASG